MATISQTEEDIFTVRAPGKKEGDILVILDSKDSPRKVRLGLPMGEEFAFSWVDESDQAEPDSDEKCHFQKDEQRGWLIKTVNRHNKGDAVRVETQAGAQAAILGDPADDSGTLFFPKKNNHFMRNPSGDDPKWCVRVYDEGVSPGDIVTVKKKGGDDQQHKLIGQVEDGVWITKKA